MPIVIAQAAVFISSADESDPLLSDRVHVSNHGISSITYAVIATISALALIGGTSFAGLTSSDALFLSLQDVTFSAFF